MAFAEEIIDWYLRHKRDLPWRKTKDPYYIWLSEIILQQTRVAQGLSYYHIFTEHFPTLQSLADSSEESVLRHWQGLGYYSRARNLHKAAKIVMEKHDGVFPNSYEQLLTLPGIGEYTASAIASFAANEPYAVLDGNVFRVLSRYFGVSAPINTPKGKKEFMLLANKLIDRKHPAIYNQAIMEFGALQCRPKNPLCGDCPLAVNCFALKHKRVNELPIKLKKAKSRDRYFHYFIIRDDDKVLMNRRGAGDIWQHLYEFPLIETDRELEVPELFVEPVVTQFFGEGFTVEYSSKLYKHILTHQNIYARFYELSGSEINIDEKHNWNYVFIKELDKLAKSKLIVSFLELYF